MNISYIVNKKLCSGCGACSPICPTNSIKIIKGNMSNYPVVDETCIDCGKCMRVCPGNSLLNRIDNSDLKKWDIEKLKYIYVGNSTNENIRYNSASGGIITTLLLYMLNKKMIDGAIVASKDKDNVLKNKSIYVTNAEEILNCSGSRYTAVSNCEIINNDLFKNKKIAFVGKPCEIEAIDNYMSLSRNLNNDNVIKISIICAAQTFNTNVEKVLLDNKIDIKNVESINFRGKGWPGNFNVILKDGSELKIPYMEAWNKYFSKKYSLRCKLCDDSLGRNADIVVGDPWNERYSKEVKGKSLFFARSKKGQNIIQECIENNIIEVDRFDGNDLPKFQKNLLFKYNRLNLEHIAYKITFFNNREKSKIKILTLKDKLKILKKSTCNLTIKYKNYYI